ncbi:TIGR02452 family protein [Streptomyces sp. NBC_01142]|uniref:TIGR02452 family protein n=1 Tax=Streptomyces sp. NBC_01142 TaxID=2975865 RepID=UPI0022514D27|nr:TIGR02452 family protein [Streptomyces sp. NBC_01142]MCX4820876.1 TIGR02452 family protein [Streptomyces sp. NBC_01142]
MSARLRGIAKETEEIVEAGRYHLPGGREIRIGTEVSAALEGTRMYGPGPVPVTPGTDRTTAFEVTGESSMEAARRLTAADAGPVAVLNFASARNPGGGYLNGAQAQEEALCRASALYVTLLRAPEFYSHHRADRSPFYTDRVIHSPGVPVFRDDRGRLLDAPYTVGFLTSPAPNAGVIAMRTPDQAHRIPAALAARAERVLETAAGRGYRRLVLGAWGCGVFRNDPAVVAGAFHALLTGGGRFAGHFEEIVFAVLDRTPAQATLGAFQRTFADRLERLGQRQP